MPSGGRALRDQCGHGDPLDGRAYDDRDGGGSPEGRARRSKLDPREAFVRVLIVERDDITLEEMRVRLKDERDLTVGLGILWAFLGARGLTYKKRQRTPRIRTVPT